MGRAFLLASALGLAASAGLGCASGGSADAAPPLPDDGGFRVVVAPLNLAFPLPIEVEDERDQVFRELLRYYLEHDVHVAIVPETDATLLWQESVAAASGAEDPSRLEAVARSFARSLADHADFDLVVLPALVHRETRLHHGVARWDGVQRRLRVRDRSTPGTDTMLIWNRDIAALSLHVLFVTHGGEHVSQGLGGISLLQEAVLPPGGAEKARLMPTRKVVSWPTYVREGVAQALAAAPLP